VIISGITYASRIQRNLLPKESIVKMPFSDYSIIWNPRDIVGGDIYWIKNFGKGTVLCTCDCTGHGTPGALLTVLVVSALEAFVREDNCHETADIIWQLEQRLVNVLNVATGKKRKGSTDIQDGCDLAVLFIGKDGGITFSSGNMHIFVCDGKNVRQFKGQKIFVGEGRMQSKDEINTFRIAPNPANKYYIATDGLYDQVGGSKGIPFGYSRFKKIILDNHHLNHEAVSAEIWNVFEEYRGSQPRRDDLQLICFTL
jgi:hypothetical protein